MSARLDVFDRWQRRFPGESDGDPRGDAPCARCGTTIEWRGYDGLCAWCYESEPGRALTAGVHREVLH
jgi:hypothetical protein